MNKGKNCSKFLLELLKFLLDLCCIKIMFIYLETLMSVTPYGIQNNLQNVYIYTYIIIKSNCAVDIQK